MTTSDSFVTLNRRDLLQGAGALGLAGMVPSPASAAASFRGAAEIQAIIDQRVAAKQLPGAIVAHGNGAERPQFVFGGTLDFDSPAKVDENTIWRLASMTKPVAGMAAMLLIGEGKLKLDQPVADFIPGFANMRVVPDPKSTESRPAARLITIRHLVTHTSGIANDTQGTVREAYRRQGVGGGPGAPAASATPAGDAMAPPSTLEEWTNRIAMVPLTVDPGTKWLYSPNLDIIGRVVEIVSGMPFDIFLERRMFLPLGMRSTYFWVPERDKVRLVTSYTQRDGALVPGDRGPTSRLLNRPAIPRGSGGLVSSARDYDRFLAMLINKGTLDGTTVIPANAVELGMSNLLPPGTDMSEFVIKADGFGFGAGGQISLGGLRPGTFGWGGASGTTGYCNARLKSRWGTYTNIGGSDFSQQTAGAANMRMI